MTLLTSVLNRLILLSPNAIARNLEHVAASGRAERVPNLWQLGLGVLRMHHRVVFRFESIGTCEAFAVRNSRRARLLEFRPLRFPFLLAERAVAPWDYSGLLSQPERLIRHLLGAHHDARQFTYDLQLLSCYPGALPELQRRCRRVVDGTDPRSGWLRDLTVYENYHDELLEAIERVLAGDEGLTPEEEVDPDISFWAYLGWCARQPATPSATLTAWREDRFRFSDGLRSASC